MAARILHAGASCVLGPVIAAISLGLVGHAALGTRLGRNARFASIGNGVAAAAMGACGYLVSNQAVFFLTALLAAPAMLALARIRMGDVEPLAESGRRGTELYAACLAAVALAAATEFVLDSRKAKLTTLDASNRTSASRP
jgi:hypothetical protein